MYIKINSQMYLFHAEVPGQRKKPTLKNVIMNNLIRDQPDIVFTCTLEIQYQR